MTNPKTILAALLALFAFGGARADDAALEAPGEVPIARLWERFLATARFKDAMGAYDVLTEIDAENGAADATKCAAAAGKLDASLRTVPVSFALWRQEYACASATGDAAREKRAFGAIEALSRDALQFGATHMDSTPIRIVAEVDADAFVAASGLEVEYAYYDTGNLPRHLTLNVALVDRESGREQLLTFDFLDTLVRLKRDEPQAEFPVFREVFARSILKDFGKNERSPARHALDMQAAFALPDIKQRVDRIAELAEHGFPAAAAMFGACRAIKEPSCWHREVDLLLPYAEARNAQALAMLARLYADGLGVERDTTAARKLLDSADARLGGSTGSLMFAALDLVGGDRRMSPVSRKQIERAAKDGDPRAQTLVALFEIATDGKLSKDGARWAEAAAKAGVPEAQTIHAGSLVLRGDLEGARKLLETAADGGSPVAATLLAERYESGRLWKKDPELALRWLVRAGQDGSIASMRKLGLYFLGRNGGTRDDVRAEGWLRSAANKYDVESGLELAALWRTGRPGLDGDAKSAAALYRELIAVRKSRDAAVELAAMLVDGEGVEKNLDEARKLLTEGADAGHAGSQRQLGYALITGTFGAPDAEAGVKWMRKAIDQNDLAAFDALAVLLYEGKLVKADRAESLRLLTIASDVPFMPSVNNLAWMLCTSHDAAVRDPKRGRVVAGALGEKPRWSWLDTQAACQAATGDFDTAVASQTAALDAANDASEKTRGGMRQRLERYRRREAFVDDVD